MTCCSGTPAALNWLRIVTLARVLANLIFFADNFDALQSKVGHVTSFASSHSLGVHTFP